MNESTLLRISMIVSAIGLVLLFLISTGIEISDTTISKMSGEETAGDVVVYGTIDSISGSDSFTSITLSEKNSIEAIAFSKVEGLSTGDNVRIRGKMDDGKLMIDSIERNN